MVLKGVTPKLRSTGKSFSTRWCLAFRRFPVAAWDVNCITERLLGRHRSAVHTAERCHNKARGREAHPGWGRRGQGNPSGVQQTARHNPGCANGGVNRANRVALFNPVGVGGLLATRSWGARARPQALMWHAAGVRAAERLPLASRSHNAVRRVIRQ